MRFRNWRYFWDYSGGNMTDQGTHLMDVVQWFTNSGTPLSAICYGQVAKMIGSEAPDVFCAVFEYPEFMATWTLNYCNSYDNDWSIQFQGDKGTMIIDQRGLPGMEGAVAEETGAGAEDGGAGADRDAHPEFSGLREVAERAECAGGSGGERGGGAAPGESRVSSGPPGIETTWGADGKVTNVSLEAAGAASPARFSMA